MKTWTHVNVFIERRGLPFRVDGETLKNFQGHTVARSVQAARDYFVSPGHPDSKRQVRRKQRDLARHGGRVFKATDTVITPLLEGEERRAMARLCTYLLRFGFDGCPDCGGTDPKCKTCWGSNAD